jgi:hypothetical protein
LGWPRLVELTTEDGAVDLFFGEERWVGRGYEKAPGRRWGHEQEPVSLREIPRRLQSSAFPSLYVYHSRNLKVVTYHPDYNFRTFVIE